MLKNKLFLAIFLFSALIFGSTGEERAHAMGKRMTTEVHGRMINYGDLDLSNVRLWIHYYSRGNSDGSCPTCYSSDFQVRVQKDGSYTIPSFPIDPRVISHHFMISYSLDDKAPVLYNGVYICDDFQGENGTLPCDTVFEKDVATISAYSFSGLELHPALNSGADFGAWLQSVGGFTTRIAMYTTDPSSCDSWSCLQSMTTTCKDLQHCQVDAGAFFLIGDGGENPVIHYKVDSAYTHWDYWHTDSQHLMGVEGLEFDREWDGSLPSEILNPAIGN